MTFSIPCECGNSVAVTASQAGTRILCSCGRSLSVPLLSQLRKMAGQGAYEAGTIDKIQRMIREGQLPPGDICAVCGLPTTDSLDFYIQCESGWTKGLPGAGSHWFAALAIVFLPIRIIGWVLTKSRSGAYEGPRAMGRDRGLYVPLRVRQEHQQQLRQTRNQSQLRQMLRTVPIYATLLDEFPRARIATSQLD